LPVQIVVENGPYKGVVRAEVERRLKAMLRALQLEESELSIVLTNDTHIHELNKLYRGKDKPTDVLAFAMREGEFSSLAGDILGDVIVSVPTAVRQAQERGVETLAEVTMLLAHGLLHLLGWDHDTAAKDRAMRKETERLVAAATRTRGQRKQQPRG
jgi:probable rRNA maturation factor